MDMICRKKDSMNQNIFANRKHHKWLTFLAPCTGLGETLSTSMGSVSGTAAAAA